MCWACYEEFRDEYGPPQATPAAIAAAGLIQAVYDAPGGGVGGGLHIVLDDLNLEDDSLTFCGEHLRNDAERACHAAFLPLTMPERVATMAIYDGFLKLD